MLQFIGKKIILISIAHFLKLDSVHVHWGKFFKKDTQLEVAHFILNPNAPVQCSGVPNLGSGLPLALIIFYSRILKENRLFADNDKQKIITVVICLTSLYQSIKRYNKSFSD